MFKGIDIKLAGPICDCEKQHMSWYTIQHKEGPGLGLKCKNCGTQLIVPYEKFTATFVITHLNKDKTDDKILHFKSDKI